MTWPIGLSMGHLYTMVMASHVKRILKEELSPEWRLQFLKHLEKMSDSTLTPAVLSLIEPMDDYGSELLEEARKLGYGGPPPNMFWLLAKKFDVFAALNPSIIAAYDEACRPWGSSYANTRAETSNEGAD